MWRAGWNCLLLYEQRYVKDSKVLFKVSSYGEAAAMMTTAGGGRGAAAAVAPKLAALHAFAGLVRARVPTSTRRVALWNLRTVRV